MGEDDPQFNLGYLLADLDGCEPGDFMRGLIDEARRSQDGYGYAMSGRTEQHLRMAIDAEIDAHEEWLAGEGKVSGIYDPEDIERALKEIADYKANRTNKKQVDKWIEGL